MAEYISPGVYSREIDLSQYAPALATAIFAVVGTAQKGPVNDPTPVTSALELQNKFGVGALTHYAVYAMEQYLRNGRQGLFVRVTDGTESAASKAVAGAAQIAFFKGFKNLSGGIDLSVRYRIRVTIDGSSHDINLRDSYTGDLTDVPIEQIITAINNTVAGAAAKDNLNAYPIIRGTVAGEASGEVTIEAYADPLTDAGQHVFGVPSIPYTVTGIDAEAAALTVYAESPGTFANGLQIRIENGTTTGTFKLSVWDVQSNLLETYDNLTKANVEKTINGVSAYIVVDDEGNDSLPDPATYLATPPTPVSYSLAGGADGISTISDADYIGTVTGGVKTGLKTLNNPEIIDVNIVATPGVSSGPVVLELLELCRSRGDCLAIVDPPMGLDYDDVIDWHNGNGAYDGLHPTFNSSYGATYWPWVEQYDPNAEERVFTPPSGWVAAQMAFTDYLNDPWYAPAGLTRGRLNTALRLEKPSPDLGQRDFLYGNGNAVNPIVDFPRDGILIYGQRTLQRTASALDRVNVRRMLLFARKLIATVSQILVFEPNDSTLWRRATNLINPILNRIKAGRGIEEFQVRIDSSTNPPDVRNRNEMHGKLFIIPTKAAEKIVLDFVILPSGAEFSEG